MLISERLKIRAMTSPDVDYIAKLFDETESSANFYAELDLPRTHEDLAAEFVVTRDDAIYFAITLFDDTFVGMCGVAWGPPSYRQNRVCRISLQISDAHQRTGYGFEARVVLCEFLFAQMNVHRIIGGYMYENVASRAQALRTGARICGRMREVWYFNGSFHDIEAWSLDPDSFHEACPHTSTRVM